MSITARTASQVALAVEQNDDDFLSSAGYAQAGPRGQKLCLGVGREP